MPMIGDKESRRAELSKQVALWGDRIGDDNARDYQRARWQGQIAFLVTLAWLALAITFQLMRTGVPIAVVTLLAWPVMIYLWVASLRRVLRVSEAVVNRYGLPRRLRWNVPLLRPVDFDQWLARRTNHPDGRPEGKGP